MEFSFGRQLAVGGLGGNGLSWAPTQLAVLTGSGALGGCPRGPVRASQLPRKLRTRGVYPPADMPTRPENST